MKAFSSETEIASPIITCTVLANSSRTNAVASSLDVVLTFPPGILCDRLLPLATGECLRADITTPTFGDSRTFFQTTTPTTEFLSERNTGPPELPGLNAPLTTICLTALEPVWTLL